MDDRADPMFLDQAGDQRLIGDVAPREHRAFRDGPFEACDEIVDHHDAPSSVEQCKHRVASNIAGAAGDEYGGAASILFI
jgi:hypothetical protein